MVPVGLLAESTECIPGTALNLETALSFSFLFKETVLWSSLVAQWVKDPGLSLQHLGSLLWRGFDPWPGNFQHATGATPPQKKEKETVFC